MGEEWLDGWQEIASYLKVSVKTAQRYHDGAELPVRTPGGMRVKALRREIDEWFARYTITAKK